MGARLYAETDLRFIGGQFSEYAKTTYFEKKLGEHIEGLRSVADELLRRLPDIDQSVSKLLVSELWVAGKHLSGSVARESPYEMVALLKSSFGEWAHDPGSKLLTTALLPERVFRFEHNKEDFYELAKYYLGISIPTRLIQVAMPRLYRHSPLLCQALFHELGHFVDMVHNVSGSTLLHFPPDAGSGSPLPQSRLHRQEYFADLFAASYAGAAYVSQMEWMGFGKKESESHPATADRLTVLNAFLGKQRHPVIDMFQETLSKAGLPALGIRFRTPDVSDTLFQMRPHVIGSSAEAWGLLPSGYALWRRMIEKPEGNWERLDNERIGRLINDLIEKSIRNWMIVSSWNGTTIKA